MGQEIRAIQHVTIPPCSDKWIKVPHNLPTNAPLLFQPGQALPHHITSVANFSEGERTILQVANQGREPWTQRPMDLLGSIKAVELEVDESVIR